MIFRIWSHSKPTYGKYLYKGEIHQKSREFIEIERDLCCIRLGLKILSLILAICLVIVQHIPFLYAILLICIHIFIADVSTLPLYYSKLSKVIY